MMYDLSMAMVGTATLDAEPETCAIRLPGNDDLKGTTNPRAVGSRASTLQKRAPNILINSPGLLV